MNIVEIQRMQDNLHTIRKAAGLTKKELAEQIGVEKETIGKMESGKSKMTESQYLALRSILEPPILDAYIDHPDKYTEYERTSILHNGDPVTRTEREAEKGEALKDLNRDLDFVDIATDIAPGAMGVIAGFLGSRLVKYIRKGTKNKKKR